MGDETLAGFCEFYPLAYPLEELGSEFFFQLLYLYSYGRLRIPGLLEMCIRDSFSSVSRAWPPTLTTP